MKIQSLARKLFATVIVGLAGCTFIPACRAAGANQQLPPDQHKRFAAMQAKGKEASLTVFPVVIGDNALPDAADVLALLLEQAGMTNLERTDTVFRLSDESPSDQAAKLFGAFVLEHPIKTEYALYAQFVGTRATGVKEIRGVIVDRTGQSVLVDLQTPADRNFKRAKPDCPMDCCVFLAERVRTQLRIPKSARDDSGEGRIARMLAKKSPAPDKAELAAMARRQAAMRRPGRRAKLTVYPVRLTDDEVSMDEAAQLANLLSKKKLIEAEAVDSPLRVKIEPARDEQKLLWELARSFQNHVKQNPPEADYALLTDYIMHPSGERAWAVHFVICDRDGEWVIVDFQNDHHGDFQSVDPKTHADCGRLVAKRLKGYLR